MAKTSSCLPKMAAKIIYGSPCYLDLILHCSNGTPVRKNLSGWPALPIGMCYHLPSRSYPDDEDEALALLKHSYRICFIKIMSSGNLQWGKVFAAMQEPFPFLRHLEFSGTFNMMTVLPSGFLGRSAPRLQGLFLEHISFPELLTLLLSARDLVSLKLMYIPPTGYISPEAMVTGLTALTMLEALHLAFFPQNSRPEEKRRRPDSQMRVSLLPALTDFTFGGRGEYLEDLVAQINAPRLLCLRTSLAQLDFLRLPQLVLFIGCSQNLRFRRVEVVFFGNRRRGELNIELRVDRCLSKSTRPSLSLYTSFEWSGTHRTHVAHVLGVIFEMCSWSVAYLYIEAGEDHPAWHSNIDSAEWPPFFRLFTTVETLHIVGTLARQVARALDDVPEEMVTEVLPSLRLLTLQDSYIEEPTSAQRFVLLRQLYGSPVAIGDPHDERVEGL